MSWNSRQNARPRKACCSQQFTVKSNHFLSLSFIPESIQLAYINILWFFSENKAEKGRKCTPSEKHLHILGKEAFRDKSLKISRAWKQGSHFYLTETSYSRPISCLAVTHNLVNRFLVCSLWEPHYLKCITPANEVSVQLYLLSGICFSLQWLPYSCHKYANQQN